MTNLSVFHSQNLNEPFITEFSLTLFPSLTYEVCAIVDTMTELRWRCDQVSQIPFQRHIAATASVIPIVVMCVKVRQRERKLFSFLTSLPLHHLIYFSHFLHSFFSHFFLSPFRSHTDVLNEAVTDCAENEFAPSLRRCGTIDEFRKE